MRSSIDQAIRRSLLAVLSAALVVLVASCSNLLSTGGGGGGGQDEPVGGSLSVETSALEGSTIRPADDLIGLTDHFVLTLTNVSGTFSPIVVDPYTSGDTVTGIGEGDWTLTLGAFSDAAGTTKIADGVITLPATGNPLAISDGVQTDVTVRLEPNNTSGSGTVDYTIDISDAAIHPEIDSVVVELDPAPYDGPSDPGNTILNNGTDYTFDPGPGTPQFNLSLGSQAAGSYFVITTFSKTVDGSPIDHPPIIEALQVYENLQSSKTITLQPGDFSGPPAPPTGLGVTLGDGTFDLDWTDASNTELGFRLYEGPVDGTAEGAVGPSATTIASASISGAPGADTQVTYNVVSYNQFGESAPATITFTPLDLGTLFPAGTPGSPTTQNASVTLGWGTFFGVGTYNLYISQTQTDVDNLDPGVRTPNAIAGNAASSYISLTDGTTYYWTVEAVNPEGNGTLAAPTAAFTVDATPPAGLSIDTSAPATNDTTPTIAWTGSGETGASFRWELRDSGSFLEDSATGVTATSYTVGTALAEDTYTFTIWESDAVGNESAPQSYTFEIDTTAPAAPTFTSLPPDPTNNTSVTFTVQGEPFANYAPSLSGATTSTPSSQLDTDSSGDETFDVGFNEGATTITATQTDQAGNVSPAASVTINVDTTPPGAPTGVASAEVTSGLTADQTPTFTWTSGGGGNDTYEYSTDNGSTWTGGVSGPTVTVPTLAPGNYTFLVREFDGAGNVSAASTGFAFEVVDTGDATITVDNPSVPSFTVTPSSDPLIVDIAGGTYSQSGTVEITSGSSITRYEWKINGTTELVGATQSTVTVDAGTGPLPASPLVFGLNTLTIIVEVDGRQYIETSQFTVVDQ